MQIYRKWIKYSIKNTYNCQDLTILINSYSSSMVIALCCLKLMLWNSILTRKILTEYRAISTSWDSYLRCGAENVPAEARCGKEFPSLVIWGHGWLS